MKVTIIDNSGGALAHIKVEGWDRIRRAVLYFWQACQTSLHLRSNPSPFRTPAPKGNPPAVRTGFLAANVIYELDQQAMAGRVGVLSNAKYGLFLELRGWSWLQFTLDKTINQLKAIVGGRS